MPDMVVWVGPGGKCEQITALEALRRREGELLHYKEASMRKKPAPKRKKKPVAVVLLVHDETLMERFVRWLSGQPVSVAGPVKRERKRKPRVRPVCL